MKSLMKIAKSLNFSISFLRDRKVINNLGEAISQNKLSSQNEPIVEKNHLNSQKIIRDLLVYLVDSII
jgi:hypothetical protein